MDTVNGFSVEVARGEIKRALKQGRKPAAFYLEVVRRHEENTRFALGAVERARRSRKANLTPRGP